MQSYKIWLARIEVSLAVLTGILGVLTLLWRDWIEALTGWSPDHHSGSPVSYTHLTLPTILLV